MKIIFAFVGYIIGIIDIVDWFVFWNKNEALALSDRTQFMAEYKGHFPAFLQKIYDPIYSTLIMLALFVYAGFIFINKKNWIFKVIAVSSFILAAWMLFSLM